MAQGLDTRHSPQLRLRCTQTDQDARIKDMSPAPARWHRHAVASESLSHSSSPHRLPCRAPPLHLARASYMIHDSCPLEGLSCLVLSTSCLRALGIPQEHLARKQESRHVSLKLLLALDPFYASYLCPSRLLHARAPLPLIRHLSCATLPARITCLLLSKRISVHEKVSVMRFTSLMSPYLLPSRIHTFCIQPLTQQLLPLGCSLPNSTTTGCQKRVPG